MTPKKKEQHQRSRDYAWIIEQQAKRENELQSRARRELEYYQADALQAAMANDAEMAGLRQVLE